jgi:hypothetical protein
MNKGSALVSEQNDEKSAQDQALTIPYPSGTSGVPAQSRHSVYFWDVPILLKKSATAVFCVVSIQELGLVRHADASNRSMTQGLGVFQQNLPLAVVR